jgi:hypothetical protein
MIIKNYFIIILLFSSLFRLLFRFAEQNRSRLRSWLNRGLGVTATNKLNSASRIPCLPDRLKYFILKSWFEQTLKTDMSERTGHQGIALTQQRKSEKSVKISAQMKNRIHAVFHRQISDLLPTLKINKI